MVQNEKVVQEIFGRDPSAIDFVFAQDSDWELDLFISNGKSVRELADQLPPTKIELFSRTEDGKTGENPTLIIPDLGNLSPGTMVISKLAIHRLESFWLRFGELIPIDVEGMEYYYYNVTNVLENVVDLQNSILNRRGRLETPAFFAEKIPSELTLFRVPEKKGINLYISGTGFLDYMRSHNIQVGVEIIPVWSASSGCIPAPKLFRN
jgi:hypothetical protein